MSGVELDGLRAAAEAATPGPWQSVHDEYGDEWWFGGLSDGGQHVIRRSRSSSGWIVTDGDHGNDAAYIAAANPAVILGLLDRLADAEAAVERVRAALAADATARDKCREDDDCPCAYKDCYECGKWHNCTHTPLTGIRDALDGPQRPTGDAVALGGAEDASEAQIEAPASMSNHISYERHPHKFEECGPVCFEKHDRRLHDLHDTAADFGVDLTDEREERP